MTDEAGHNKQYEENVEQERVQDNPNWGEENKLPDPDKKEYWNEMAEENDIDTEGAPGVKGS